MATSWRWAMVCLLLTVAVPQVKAQELANSFDQLLVLAKLGDTVSVTDGTGRETRGTIAALSSSSLELLVAGNRRSFLESETRTIRQRRSDPLKNGALWGLGIGAGYALLIVNMEAGLTAGGAVAGTLMMGVLAPQRGSLWTRLSAAMR